MGKKNYLEILRIIAIIFVIYNHTRNIGFNLFTVTNEKVSYLLSFTMYPICKIAVPIFLMISGVNLLGKKEKISTLYKKRVLKQILIIIIFGTLQFLRYLRVDKVTLSLSTWFSSIYSNPLLETYWFLYMYLGFLLMLPLLRKLVICMDEKDYTYIFLLYTSFKLITLVGYFSGYFVNGNIFNLPDLFIYPILGYGLDKYCHSIKKYIGLILTIFGWLLIITTSYLYININPYNILELNSILQLGTPVIACGIFIITMTYSRGKNNIIICSMGSCTFGIYLIEDIVRNQIEKIINKYNLLNRMNDFFVSILFVFSTFLISFLTIYFFKSITNNILKRVNI